MINVDKETTALSPGHWRETETDTETETETAVPTIWRRYSDTIKTTAMFKNFLEHLVWSYGMKNSDSHLPYVNSLWMWFW